MTNNISKHRLFNAGNAPLTPARRDALRIALTYAAVGSLWIFGSGWLLHHLIHNEGDEALLENLKGWAFVIVTALLLGVHLDRYFGRLRRSARQAQEGEIRLRLVADNVPESYVYQYSIDDRGNPYFTYLTAGAERIHGVKVDQILKSPSSVLSQLDPEQQRALQIAQATSAETLSDVALELKITRPSGEKCLLRLKSKPHRDIEGRIFWDGVATDITAEKESVTALERSEQNYREIFNATNDAIFLHDASSGQVLDVNEAMLRMYGFSSKAEWFQEGSERVFGKVPPYTWKEAQRRIRLAVEQGPQIFEWKNQKKDGEPFWVEVSLRSSEIGGHGRVLAVVRDISVRKEAEARLQESEQRFRALVETAPEGIFVRTDDRFTYLNPTALKMFGATSMDQLLGTRVIDRFQKNSQNVVSACIKRFDSEEIRLSEVDRVLVRLNGAEVAASISAVHISFQGEKSSLVFARDVSERKRVEAQLRKLSRAVEQSPGSIVITDPRGNIEYVNSKFTELTGYTLEEVKGKNSRILKSGQTSAEEYRNLWRTITRGGTWRGELLNRKKDGQTFWELASISPILDDAGNTTHFLAVKEDITGRKLLESQLRQSQKLEAIGQLAGGIAHDFNNILAAMMMQAELALTSPGISTELFDGLHQIREAAGRAARLTHQLLLFSRKQVLQPCNLDLNETISGLAKMLRRIIREDIQLQLNLHPSPLIAFADPGMIDQIVINLAVNARDAMPNGGCLTIETSAVVFDGGAAGGQPDLTPGQYVSFTITDNGVGISPDVMSRLFEPFFTTKEPGKGTGLGLATVFGIVNQHHGKITVQSEPGKGARFQVFLPVAKTIHAISPDIEIPAPAGNGHTILLVEDDPFVRVATRLLLERNKYKVIEAANGVDGLRLWQENRNTVSLLLTDLVMPGGLTGQQLALQILARKPDLPIVFTSGYIGDSSISEIQLRPDENFIQKPCAPDSLLALLGRKLNKIPSA